MSHEAVQNSVQTSNNDVVNRDRIARTFTNGKRSNLCRLTIQLDEPLIIECCNTSKAYVRRSNKPPSYRRSSDTLTYTLTGFITTHNPLHEWQETNKRTVGVRREGRRHWQPVTQELEAMLALQRLVTDTLSHNERVKVTRPSR